MTSLATQQPTICFYFENVFLPLVSFLSRKRQGQIASLEKKCRLPSFFRFDWISLESKMWLVVIKKVPNTNHIVNIFDQWIFHVSSFWVREHLKNQIKKGHASIKMNRNNSYFYKHDFVCCTSGNYWIKTISFLRGEKTL